MLKDLFQVPDKVKKLVLGWLSHIVFLHFSNDVEHPENQNQNGTSKQSKVKPTHPLCVRNICMAARHRLLTLLLITDPNVLINLL